MGDYTFKIGDQVSRHDAPWLGVQTVTSRSSCGDFIRVNGECIGLRDNYYRPAKLEDTSFFTQAIVQPDPALEFLKTELTANPVRNPFHRMLQEVYGLQMETTIRFVPV